MGNPSSSSKPMPKIIKLAQQKNVLIFLICLGAIQFILQLCVLANGVEYIMSSLTNDDAFYYLQTAWNIKKFGFVTFDGLHATNGVQLLWFGILALLGVFIPTKTAFLFASLILCFLLNIFCYLIIYKLGKILKRPIFSLFLAGLWSMLSFTTDIYSIGMENSLHAFIFWCVIWQVMVFLMRVRDKQTPNFLALTFVLILNAWTRLDSAFFSVILYVYCIAVLAYNTRSFRLFLQKNIRGIVSSCLFAGMGAIVLLAGFWLMGGSFLPVSALIKSSVTTWGWGTEALKRLMEILIFSVPQVRFFIPPIVFGLVGLASLLILIGVWSAKLCSYSKELVVLRNLWFCLLGAVVFYHIVIIVFGMYYPLTYIWYRSPLFIFWIITFSLTANIPQDITLFKRFNDATHRVLLGFSLLIVVISGLGFPVRVIATTNRTNIHTIRYNAALWISENSPPDAIYASWNAGELGYFCNRTLINLDGLINSIDYYENVLQGSVLLSDYLYENKVDYIVDYYEGKLKLLPSRSTVIHAFPKSKRGKWLRIWKIPHLPDSED
jgi:hypothetical protein